MPRKIPAAESKEKTFSSHPFHRTVSLTYEVQLGDLTGLRRQWSSSRKAQEAAETAAENKARWDRDVQAQAAMTQLENTYLKFEQLRAEALAAPRAHSATADVAFYQLRHRRCKCSTRLTTPGVARHLTRARIEPAGRCAPADAGHGAQQWGGRACVL
jgi:hypothetical protein